VAKKSLFDFSSPFFRPLPVRASIVLVCFGWGFFEFINQNVFWGIVFCGLGALCLNELFLRETKDFEEDE
jgi:hypothetical protein